jgi:uncharacterized HAD superfamily protein
MASFGEHTYAAFTRSLQEVPPALGIDIDGCVDEVPLFFHLITKHWPGKVYVLSFRSDREKAIADLAKFQIRYDELILVSTFGMKAEIIEERGIQLYFDDQPEMLKNVAATTGVMLVRNEGNFDFDDKKWMLSEQTGKLI